MKEHAVRLTWILSSALIFLGHGIGHAEDAAPRGSAEYIQGERLLSEGEIQAALKQFDAAVQADPLNDEYVKQATTVRKVLALRRKLDDEQDLGRRVKIARGLHIFYHQHELYEACLAIDRQLHGELNSPISAALLAQTLMACERNGEAAALLTGLPEDKQGLGTRTMGVVALARSGRREQASKWAASVEVPEHLCAGKAYSLARMYAAVRADDKAASLLELAFANAPNNRLDAFKNKAKQCPEFSRLWADSRYASLLQTQSAGQKADDHDHDHDDDHGPEGHCVDCPAQDRVQDMSDNGDHGHNHDAD